MLPVVLRSRPRAERAALVVALASIVWLLWGAPEPLRLNWGDPWSDANVLTTLEYSAKYGFWKTSFTDVLDIGPLTAESYRYTHYPPLTEIFYGLVRKVVGKADIGVYRLFAIAFSGAALIALYRYVARMFGALAAAYAVVLLATNALFLQYADSMHQAPVLGFTTFAALAFAARFVDEARRKDLALTAAFTFCAFLTAYDFYFFLPIAGIGTAWLRGKRLFEKTTLQVAGAIAIGGALAIVLKSLFIIGALGWHDFKQDFVFQFLERATAKYSVDYKLGLAKVVGARVFLYMTPLFFLLLLAHLARAWRDLKDPEQRGQSVAAPLVFLAAGVPFPLVFSQLTATQVLPMQCIVPYYAIGFGVLLARLHESAVSWRSRGAVAAGAICTLVVGWQVLHVGTFEKSFLREEDRKAVVAYLQEHDQNDFVLTNLLADGPIQYYFDRHLHPIDPRWDTGTYRKILGRVRADRVHVVFFDDPNTRYGDKSLFPIMVEPALLAEKPERWWLIGAPSLQRKTALDAIARCDRLVRTSLEAVATRKLQAGDITVYQIGWDEIFGLMRTSGWLKVPTEGIDFSKDFSDDYKVYGIRGKEPGKGYAWSIPRRRDRTVLTKTGLVWRDGGSLLETALFLNLPPGSDYKVTVRVFSHLPEQTLGAMVGERVLLPPQPLGEPWKSRVLSFVVPKELLGPDPLVTVRFPFAVAGKTKEAVPQDGEEIDVGVAFESLRVERVP
jgi:hypothetical protein